jgi:hypothetical protein
MKILDKWRRPKWQHPDASVRLKGLAEEAIDVADCHALAVSDPDPAVREQAIDKLESVEQLLNVLRAQPAAHTAVAARLTAQLLQTTAATLGPQLPPALAAIRQAPGLAQLAIQAADPEIRVAAVAIVADPATLRRCALEDRAVEVRLQAVERIDDEDTLQTIRRAAKGHDKTVARLATQRLSDLRIRRERTAERAQLLEEFAHLAESADLDADAVHRARARWQSLEGDAETAQCECYAALAPRLDARLAALRKAQQKDLSHRAAREAQLARLRQLAVGLSTAIPKEARATLKDLHADWEQATPLRDRWTERRLQEEWQEAADKVESGLREREKLARQEHRIAAAITEFEATLERGALRAEQIEAARQRCSELSQIHREDPVFERPLQRLHKLVDRMAAELARQQAELKTVRRQLKDAIEALEEALDNKQLEPATAAHKEASTLLAKGGRHPESEPLQRRLAKCEPLLRELQSWRNWGSDKAREELVDEARRLVDADIGIEERAQILKTLRARWKALGSGGQKARRLWEAFDAACTAAHEPIKQDRRDQAQQRERQLEARAGICARLESLAADTDWSTPDWRALDRELSEAKRKWRNAGGVPHKQWDAVRERFDQAVAGVEQHLSKERRHNFLQRQALVKEAQALADDKDMRHAVTEARRLREAWQVTVTSARKDEQALWKAFNAALDGVFDRDRAARDDFKAGLEEQRRQADALCAELEGLTRAEDLEVRTMRAELSRLATAFGRLGTLPRNARQGLESRFRQASDKLQQRIAATDLAHARQALLDYQVLHDICEQAEALAQNAAPDDVTIEMLATRWQASTKPATYKDLLEALEQRFAQATAAIGGSEPPPDKQTLARNAALRSEICLDLEILRKQASPADLHAERMQRQVVMLEAAMKGADEPQERTVRRLQLDYLRQGPVPGDQQPELAKRFGRLLP